MADMLNFNLPQISGDEDTKKQLKRLERYLASMTEQLRFTLANLDPETNFSTQALAQWNSATGSGGSSGGGGSGGGSGSGGSGGEGVETLFSRYGLIADLASREVRTDIQKIDHYLAGDTAAIRYLEISGGKIRFLSAVTDGTQTEQLHDGETLYWYKDAKSREIVTEDTGFPVTVYQYTETEAASIGWDGETVRMSGISAQEA